jgi:hypothetical protein
MARYVDQLIMLLVGVYASGVGFGWFPSPAKGPKAADWNTRFGRYFKIIGPLLVLIALALAGAEYLRPAGPLP